MSARILIVDDAASMRMLVRKALAHAGFEIVGEAANGIEAAERFGELKPDLVTLDMVMPEADGLEALRRIRAIDPAAKVVVVSAMDQREKIMEATRLGAADYIVKPFDVQRLVESINRALGAGVAAPS